MKELGSEYQHRLRSKKAFFQSRISWIYLYGIELEKKNDENNWIKHWLCKPCYDQGKVKTMAAESTWSCSQHLKGKHGIYPAGVLPTTAVDSPLTSYLDAVHPLAAERWRCDFMNWIAYDDITFEQASSELLHKVILGGGPHVKPLLPCARTVRSWVMTTYHERISDVKESLAGATSKINLSFDAWSSPNHLSLLGVVAHWLDSEHTLKTALLGLRPLEGHHGHEIAAVVSQVIKTFDIEHKLGAFQTDNATNNDTALSALATKIPGINTRESRLRCFGHMVNLVVKAMLYGNPQLQKELDDCSDSEAFKVWRKQGAIGRLHNLVTYIGGSDKRRRAFEQSQKVDASDLSLQLVKDIGVRWNSTYDMIVRALRLQTAIRRYCDEWEPDGEYDLTHDILQAQDWEELTRFETLLEPFDRATKRVEGNAYTGSHGALWEVIPTMDFLFLKLAKRADGVNARPERYSEHYRHCINHGFSKLQQYYTKIDDSRLYAAAVALHPCMRFKYFDKAWSNKPGGREQIDFARRQTRSLYDDYLSTLPPPEPVVESLFISSDVEEDPDWIATFGEDNDGGASSKEHITQQRQSELDRFMSDALDISLTRVVNGKIITTNMKDEPLRWWRERGQHLYPTLAGMAFDLFSIPGMSSECERAFSAAIRMLTDDRYNLKYDIIEADQCLKSWFKNRVADGQAAFTTIATAVDDGDEVVDITRQ